MADCGSRLVSLLWGHLSSDVVSISKLTNEGTGKSKVRTLSFVLIAVVISALGYLAFRRMQGLLMLGYVDSAIGRMSPLDTAETEFAKEHPAFGYTCKLSELASTAEIRRLLTKVTSTMATLSRLLADTRQRTKSQILDTTF
jgi:hypothetical protein